MKVLVLGGTRYFGKILVQKLLDAGHQVSIASTGKTPPQFSGKFEHIKIDRSSEASLTSAFQGRDWNIAYDQIGFSSNEARILSRVLHKKIEHLIFTSSQSVYDPGLSLSESDFTAEFYDENDQTKNLYQEGKRRAEKEFTTQIGFSVSSVRFPIVLGTDDYTKRLNWHISRIKNALPIYFPNINSRIGFISSEEAGQFLFWLLDKNLNGSVNAGSSDSISLRELVEVIESQLAKKIVFAARPEKDSHSPFGISSDWTMNMNKAEKLGFQFSRHQDWLPDLIAKLSGIV